MPLPPEEIARNALERGEGQSSPVILLHDSHPFTTTPEAVRPDYPGLQGQGIPVRRPHSGHPPAGLFRLVDVLSGD